MKEYPSFPSGSFLRTQVLDRAAFTLSRLWCLYEVAQTHELLGPGRVAILLPPGFELTAAIINDTVEVENALCFNENAAMIIRRNIRRIFGSEEAMTIMLRAELTRLCT